MLHVSALPVGVLERGEAGVLQLGRREDGVEHVLPVAVDHAARPTVRLPTGQGASTTREPDESVGLVADTRWTPAIGFAQIEYAVRLQLSLFPVSSSNALTSVPDRSASGRIPSSSTCPFGVVIAAPVPSRRLPAGHEAVTDFAPEVAAVVATARTNPGGGGAQIAYAATYQFATCRPRPPAPPP